MEAFPQIQDGVDSTYPLLKEAGYEALGAVQHKRAEVLSLLEKGINSDVQTVRTKAEKAIETYGHQCKSLVPRLCYLLSNQDTSIEEKVIVLEALGSIGNDASPALEQIEQLLRTKSLDWQLFKAAIDAYGKTAINQKGALETLKSLLTNENMLFHVAILKAIRNLKPNGSDIIPFLLKYWASAPQYTERDGTVIDAKTICESIIKSFQKMAIEHCENSILGQTPDERFVAAKLLGELQIPNEKGLSLLLQMVSNEMESRPLMMAIETLGKPHYASPKSIGTLNTLLNHSNDSVKSKSLETIWAICFGYQLKSIKLSISELQTLASETNSTIAIVSSNPFFKTHNVVVERIVSQNDTFSLALERERRKTFTYWLNMISDHWILSCIALYVSLLIILYIMRPRYIPKIEERLLKIGAAVKDTPEMFTLVAFIACFLTVFLRKQRRVMRSYVDHYILNPSFQNEFSKTPFSAKHYLYIDIPMSYSDGVSNTSKSDFQSMAEVWSKNHISIQAVGPGGVGKSHFCKRVVETVCFGSMGGSHPGTLIPIVLDHDLDLRDFVEACRAQLNSLLPPSDAIPRGMFEWLYFNGYVLLIIDGFTERNLAFRTFVENHLLSKASHNILISGRFTQPLANRRFRVVFPSNLKMNTLLRFMEEFFKEHSPIAISGEKLLEYFNHLTGICGNVPVTPLFARLYCNVIYNRYLANQLQSALPNSFPELVVEYVVAVNSEVNTNERLPNEHLRTVLECLGDFFCPFGSQFNQIDSVDAISRIQTTLQRPDFKDLGRPDGVLDYLVNRISILEYVSQSTKSHLRFRFDPIAEYFSAFFLARLVSVDRSCWGTIRASIFERHDTEESATRFVRIVSESYRYFNSLSVTPDWLK